MDTVDVGIEETVRQVHVLDLSEDEKEECMQGLLKFENKREKMVFNINRTARSLRAAAARLDKVWRDCKIAHAAGASAGILSGILGIAAAVPTGGAAALPLLVVGIGFGVGGAATNLGTIFLEASKNSDEIKKAEKLLKETSDSIVVANKTFQRVLKGKEMTKLAYICYLAEVLEMVHVKNFVCKIFQSHSFDFAFDIAKRLSVATGMCKDGAKAGAQGAGKAVIQVTDDVAEAGKAGLQVADDVVQSGTKVGSKTAVKCVGNVLIIANVAFLVVDCVHLGFTIRDLVEKKGSEAAKELRARAKELEDFLKKHSVK